MISKHRSAAKLFVFCWVLFLSQIHAAHAYITNPVPTLGRLCQSTYITLVRVDRVDKVNPEQGVIVYRKIRDLKGVYPRDVVKHAFSLKSTPAWTGQGDVPIRPDQQEWQYAVAWAQPGKTAVIFSLKYDPFGDFGHTYIDGCWYATMCPGRDWQYWHAIYSDPALLTRWHCGSSAQLVSAVELMLAGKDAVTPVLAGSTKADLRSGRAQIQGLKVSPNLSDYSLPRDQATGPLDRAMVPALIKSLPSPERDAQAKAVLALSLIGTKTDGAALPLLRLFQGQDAPLRLQAGLALAAIGLSAGEIKPAVAAFAATMKDPDPLLRRLAARALGDLGPQAASAVPELAALLAKAQGNDFLDLADTLVRIAPDDAATGLALASLLEDPKTAKDIRVRSALILHLSKATPIPALIRTMKDSDPDIRIAVADLLGQLGSAAKPAVPILTSAVSDDAAPAVRARAASALANIGSDARSALPALQAALKDPRLAESKNALAEITDACRRLQ